jgi:TonB family protein
MLSIKTFFLAILMMIAFDAIPQEYIHAEVYGGKQQLRDFIKEELVYPKKAISDKIEGTVVLSFTINSDGTVSKLDVAQSVSPELDDEAKRIFRQLLWNPAEYRGMKLDEEQTMEFPFKLSKYKRCSKQRGYDEIEYPFTPVDSSMKIYDAKHLDERVQPVYTEKGMNFSKFISKNLVYPEAAMKQNIQGTVELFFVVEPSGRVSNLEIRKDLGAGCSQEAIRLIKMLDWMPGIKNGMAVRTEMVVSISFNLEDFEKHRYVSPNNANQL